MKPDLKRPPSNDPRQSQVSTPPQVSGLRLQISFAQSQVSGFSVRAFSLLEVVIAVGIFATAVVTLLALLPATLRESADSLDTQIALRLPGVVESELRRLVAAEGFDALAASVPVMNASSEHGVLFVATGQGDDVRRLVAGEKPVRDQYFLIELHRFRPGPLAYVTSGTVLALNVHVSWPYRLKTPEGLATALPAAERQHLSFTLALNR